MVEEAYPPRGATLCTSCIVFAKFAYLFNLYLSYRWSLTLQLISLLNIKLKISSLSDALEVALHIPGNSLFLFGILRIETPKVM